MDKLLPIDGHYGQVTWLMYVGTPPICYEIKYDLSKSGQKFDSRGPVSNGTYKKAILVMFFGQKAGFGHVFVLEMQRNQ